MEDKEILRKSLERAESQGFDFLEWYSQEFEVGISYLNDDDCLEWLLEHPNSFGKILVFNHSFAEAFWGVYRVDCGCKSLDCRHQLSWKSYLQFMVLEEKPLKYLKKFL